MCLTLSSNEKYKPETRSSASGPERVFISLFSSISIKKTRMNGKACMKMIFGKDDGVLK